MADNDLINTLILLENDILSIASEAMEYTMAWAENKSKETTAFVDRTGNLRNSIHGDISEETPDAITGVLVAGYLGAFLEYAPHVELGTSRMAPRPYLQPALDETVAKHIFARRFWALVRKRVNG